MPYMPVAGTRIYYEESGSPWGRPLLLLHAALQTAEATEPLRALVEPAGYRMVSPDQRGHGRSANPGQGFTIARLADDMVALMAALGMERPVVAGFSLGGTVAIELAQRGLVSGLVVLASRIRAVGVGDTAQWRATAFDPADIRHRSPVWAAHLAEVHVETPWEALATQLGELFAGWPGFSAVDLAAITCPTLVVQGDHDEMVPVAQAQELTAGVPGAQLYLAPRGKHPELLYRADVQRVVGAFLGLEGPVLSPRSRNR